MSAPALLSLLAYVLQGTAILAAGALLLGLLRARDPSFRLACLESLWWSSLVLPLVFPLLPRLRPAGLAPAGGSLATTFADVTARLPAAVPRGGVGLALLLWLPSLLFLARLALGLLHLNRLSREARPLLPLPPAVERARREAGADARFALSGRIPSAVTFGWIRPVVLLPPAALELEEEALHAVALHELVHVRRRHFLRGLLEEATSALLWFHPALRPVLREIRLAREQSVDRSVVWLTGERRLYLETLAAMARRRHGAPPVLLQPFLHRGHLLRRMASLTQEVTMTKTRRWVAGLLAATAVLLTGAFAATRLPLRPTSAPPSGSVSPPGPVPAQVYEIGTLPSPKLLDGPSPVYPAEAKARGLQGRAVLEILILETGDVAPEHRVLLADDPLFADATWEAVSRWKFEPPMADGHPVRLKHVVSINFHLD
jgi:TonB family protein